MTKPMLVGLCGGIGAGKGTVANHLERTHGFTTLSFATPLKEMVRDLFRLEDRHVFGTQEDKAEPLPHVTGPDGQPRTARKLLEHMGTEGVRAMDPQWWVKLAMFRAQDARVKGHHVVFDDVRFGNEIDAIRAAGGSIWVLERLGNPHGGTGHASDLEWRSKVQDCYASGFCIAAPDGDLDGLRRMASQLFQRLGA